MHSSLWPMLFYFRFAPPLTRMSFPEHRKLTGGKKREINATYWVTLLSGFEIYCPKGTYHCRVSVADGQLSLATFWAERKLRAADTFLVVVGSQPNTAEMVDLLIMFQLRRACRKVTDRKWGVLLLRLAWIDSWSSSDLMMLPAGTQPVATGIIQPSKYTFISCQASSVQLVWL